jgi:hypothetical protein
MVVIHSRLLLSKQTPEMKLLGLRKQKTLINIPREASLCDQMGDFQEFVFLLVKNLEPLKL